MRTRSLFLTLLVILAALWYFASKNHASDPQQDRPNDPWVFRSVLDKKPRMITFALNDQLWAAYSTDSCALYKVWSGNVDFTGAVYNMRHGPQPISVGNSWFENKFQQPWNAIVNGKPESPTADYKGHRYTDGHAEIMYDLILSDGRKIRVNERPEFVEKERQVGFERSFRVENCPADVQLSFQTNAASLADPSNVEVNGATFQITQKETNQIEKNFSTMSIEGTLQLTSTQTASITTWFVNAPQIENPFRSEDQESTEGEQVSVHPGEKLMAKSDCRTCHNPQVKTVGPAYVDIAKKYKNTPENQEKLANKIIKGGAGVWGIAAMSAHPSLSLDDAKTMVN
jgi:cytochrome c